VFVDNRLIVDRAGLTAALARDSEIQVMQALSSG
jgi:hypothetical protein